MTEQAEIKIIITKLEGFKVHAENEEKEPLVLQKSKFGEIKDQTLKVGEIYEAVITEKSGTFWLNSAKIVSNEKKAEGEPVTESDKFKEILKSKSPTDVRQLLIMAQSCQHDSVAIVQGGIDFKDYGSVQEVADQIIELRDILLQDLVEKYWK